MANNILPSSSVLTMISLLAIPMCVKLGLSIGSPNEKALTRKLYRVNGVRSFTTAVWLLSSLTIAKVMFIMTCSIAGGSAESIE